VPSSEPSAEDLYENAPCGYLSTTPDGRIVRVNATFLRWTGFTADDLVGVKRFQDLLTAGGRIYHETHYAPLLRMQGSVREIAVDLVTADGRRLPALVNSVQLTDDHGEPHLVRTTVFDATERRQYERELLAAREGLRNVSLTLQQSLMGPLLPDDPRFEIAALYHPAEAHLEIGGDWYDTFELPDGKVGIVIGDVVGRGLPAAAAMGQLRSAVRALALAGLGPEAVVRHLDAFVDQVEATRYATLAYAEVDPDSGEVAFTAAGHLPPVLFPPPRVFMEGRSTPLGVTAATLPRTEARFTLAPGDGFVLYTDGLVERRTENIETGIGRVVAVLDDRLDARPEDFAAATLEPGAADDDVCVVVFRRRMPNR
jgi:PAS domain S-box-containing protein